MMAYQQPASGALSHSTMLESPYPAQLGRLDHVAVAVRDATAVAAEFASLLGLRVVRDEVVEAAGVVLMYLESAEPGGCLLQLVEPIRPGPVLDHLDSFGEGFHHICFRCDDIVRTLQRIPGQSTSGVFAGGGGAPCAFLQAPIHGARIELTQLTEPSDGAAQ